ncbi:hypothetical protein [Nocardia sp. NPDC059228]|uniref:hypothetical protein n=1 Tax=Nocardia sp. NPDC059228 TaxID=3346777 RepID=UPI0036C8EC2D
MKTVSDETADDGADAKTADKKKADRQPRRLDLRLSTVISGFLIVGLLAAAITFGVLWQSARSDIADRDAKAADDRHATQVATDYALGASVIDYHDTKAWLDKLKTDTTPQLAAKFDATAPQLEQILLPLQWTSKATPIDANVMSESGGIYKVDVFLNVTSTSAQTPQGGQTTVTYTLTIDRNAGWKITDVGGLGGALPVK